MFSLGRIYRLFVPFATLTAFVIVLLLVTPDRATGREDTGGTRVSTDFYAFGQDIRISTPVDGAAQVYFGSAVIAAPISGDLIVIGKSVRFESAGRVGGNLIYSGSLENADGRVGGRLFAFGSLEGATATMSRAAVKLSLLLLWLVGAVVVTLISGREVRASSVEVRASALHCFTLGLVAFTSFMLTAIVCGYLMPYLIGFPLLAALGVFATLTKVYGLIAVFHAIGTIAVGARTREQLDGRRWLRGDLAMVVVGVLILGAVRMIPGLGNVAWGFASIFGVGVALATKFGRREPWFLAWRPVEA